MFKCNQQSSTHQHAATVAHSAQRTSELREARASARLGDAIAGVARRAEDARHLAAAPAAAPQRGEEPPPVAAGSVAGAARFEHAQRAREFFELREQRARVVERARVARAGNARQLAARDLRVDLRARTQRDRELARARGRRGVAERERAEARLAPVDARRGAARRELRDELGGQRGNVLGG